ncbi:MAG: type II toxin-antitoxin system RelE/ParE family toxin [Tannerella sp.]|jgi:mRNA interferase RelE/StbE|nr:type II toxin-antitoxin system RelE/ParE family toxin [Tannerella sp.]
MYKVTITKSAQKEMQTIPTVYYVSIVNHIYGLAENPRPSGCVKLVGSENSFRIRVGVYRIIYTVEDDRLIVEVVKVDHRSSVYR